MSTRSWNWLYTNALNPKSTNKFVRLRYRSRLWSPRYQLNLRLQIINGQLCGYNKCDTVTRFKFIGVYSIRITTVATLLHRSTWCPKTADAQHTVAALSPDNNKLPKSRRAFRLEWGKEQILQNKLRWWADSDILGGGSHRADGQVSHLAHRKAS